MLEHLATLPEPETEQLALESIAPAATPDLRAPIDAIGDFEHVARLLDLGFQTLLHESTLQGTVPLPEQQAARNPTLAQIAAELPDAITRAADQLDRVGLHAKLVPFISIFGEKLTARGLVGALLQRHRQVQDDKEKAMWVVADERGFRVRRADYRRGDQPVYREDYLHPYRVSALRSFLQDLRGDA
jgi:hypothetical protein